MKSKIQINQIAISYDSDNERQPFAIFADDSSTTQYYADADTAKRLAAFIRYPRGGAKITEEIIFCPNGTFKTSLKIRRSDAFDDDFLKFEIRGVGTNFFLGAISYQSALALASAITAFVEYSEALPREAKPSFAFVRNDPRAIAVG
jgi:hypothetical protein